MLGGQMINIKNILKVIMAIFAISAFAQSAYSQEEFVYGYAGVIQTDFPENGGQVVGLSVTGATYGIATWYDEAHVSTLQEDGATIVQGYVQGYPEAYNFTVAPVIAGKYYTQYSDHIMQLISTYYCGTPFDAYGFSNWGYTGYEFASTWSIFSSLCISFTGIWIGYTVDEIIGQGQSFCVDACAACKSNRNNRKNWCYGVAGGCEAAAFITYEIEVTNCDNQNYCNKENPAYNAEQCGDCMRNAKLRLASTTTTCGTGAVTCFLTLPDCTGKIECPNGPTNPGTATCKN